MNLLHESVGALAHWASWSNLAQVVTVVCGLWGNVLINRKDARGFYLWLLTNALLVVLTVKTGMYLLIPLYLAYSALSVDGLRKWRKDERKLT